jgi:uncharacterized DUF497 family protein
VAHAVRVATVVFGDYEWDTDKAVTNGLSAGARLLYIVHVERKERDRIISARLATGVEEVLYTDR